MLLPIICDSREISVQCRGINPIYVNTRYETHKLERNDEMRFREGEDVKINIAGYVVIVEAPEPSTEEIQTSLPSLSPPITTTTFTEPEKKSQTVDMDSSLGLPSPSPMPENIQELPAPSQRARNSNLSRRPKLSIPIVCITTTRGPISLRINVPSPQILTFSNRLSTP